MISRRESERAVQARICSELIVALYMLSASERASAISRENELRRGRRLRHASTRRRCRRPRYMGLVAYLA